MMNDSEQISPSVELSQLAMIEQLRYWMETATPLHIQMKTLSDAVRVVVEGIVASTDPIIIKPQHGSEGFLQCEQISVSYAVLRVAREEHRLSLALAFADGTTLLVEPLVLR